MHRKGIRGVFGGVEQDVIIGAFADGEVATYRDATRTLEGAVPSGGGGAPAPGSILQTVLTESTTAATTSAAIPVDNTAPQNTEGAAYPSLDTTITPQLATSMLLVEVYIGLISGNPGATTQWIGALFRDAGVDAISTGIVTIEASNRIRQFKLQTYVAASSVAATTFKLRFGTNTNSVTVLQSGLGAALFGATARAHMKVTEIAA